MNLLQELNKWLVVTMFIITEVDDLESFYHGRDSRALHYEIDEAGEVMNGYFAETYQANALEEDWLGERCKSGRNKTKTFEIISRQKGNDVQDRFGWKTIHLELC